MDAPQQPQTPHPDSPTQPSAEEELAKLRKERDELPPSSPDELEKLRKERDEYLAGWQRAKADLSNYKKDEARRQEAFLSYAAERFLQELLPVLDSLDLAIVDAKNAGDKAREQTLWLIASQLLGILKKQGLEVMDTKGKKFDANFHESVEEVASGGEPGMIVEEVQKGYLLNGLVLRPARVKVAGAKGS